MSRLRHQDAEVFASVSWADPDVARALDRVDAALAIAGASSLVDGSKMVDALLDIRLDLLGVRP